MTFSVAGKIITSFWAILLIYWIVTAFGNKKTRISAGMAPRFAYLGVLGVAVYLILSQGSLHFQLLPINAVTQSAGILLCTGGISFAIWARRVIGRNWSGFVTIKQNHEMIQRGPYAVVRHPIYTGLILASTGTAVVMSPTAEGFLLDLVWILALYVKARSEERVLIGEFGEQYDGYKRRVKAALIPFVL